MLPMWVGSAINPALPQKLRVALGNSHYTCGSGWVDDEHAILLWILSADGDPPATAGGTDRFQQRFL